MLRIVLVALFATAVLGSLPEKQFGYVNVNSTFDSNMFYAFYRSTAANPDAAPLVIYLQGGPGASSMTYGDFMEVGPTAITVDANGKTVLGPRNTTWATDANLLFIDNPVGTGFSYTRHIDGYATTDDDIASALVTFLKAFVKTEVPAIGGHDLWVFCESYGGKMTAYFGAALVKAGDVGVNFRGVGLGDGWVDPVGCMYSYSDFLNAQSLITSEEKSILDGWADKAQQALSNGNGSQSTNYWSEQQGFVSKFANNAYWYNLRYYSDYTPDNAINKYLETNFTQQLGSLIPKGVSFGKNAGTVFEQMQGSFMNQGIEQVLEMLNAGVAVNVYSGQLDIIVDYLCTQRWIEKLKWQHLGGWRQAAKAPYFPDKASPAPGGFVQKHKNLALWTINNAGHMVPYDNGAMAKLMMKTIISDTYNKKDTTPSQREVFPEFRRVQTPHKNTNNRDSILKRQGV